VGLIGTLHDRLVVGRRVAVLSSWFARLVPQGARVLDVGCGDGLLSAALLCKRADLTICGVDVLARKRTYIHVEAFDGHRIPFDNSSFDAVLFSDVLHHADDPAELLREASRVATEWVLIKDHYREGLFAGPRLRLMDWTGNARFGVPLPYNYWRKNQWHEAWREVGLVPEEVITRLSLYPQPFDQLFGARLHFMARLNKLRKEHTH